MDEVRWPSATLAEVREKELLRSLALLGVTEHVFLDLPDVDWHTALPDQGAKLVEQLMADIEPDTVLTFGPEGMTGHVGHQSVHQWTTDAFFAVAPVGARLYYAVHEQEFGAAFAERLYELGAVRDGAVLPLLPAGEIDLTYDLEPDLLDLKVEAIEMHASQVEGMIAAFGPGVFRTGMASEHFRLAATKEF